MKSFTLSALVLLTSLVGSNANAGQACMTVGGSFTGSCKSIQISGPGCAAGRSSTQQLYGYEVSAACKDNHGQWVQRAAYPISTNIGSGGGTPKIQTQTCLELGNNNGYLACTKRP